LFDQNTECIAYGTLETVDKYHILLENRVSLLLPMLNKQWCQRQHKIYGILRLKFISLHVGLHQSKQASMHELSVC